MYTVSTVLLRFLVKFMLCITVLIFLSWESETMAWVCKHVWLINSALWFIDSALENAVYLKSADHFTEILMTVDDFHNVFGCNASKV